MAELFFQRSIDGSHHESLLAFGMVMDTVFIFLRLVRFGQDIIKDAFRIGIRSSKSLAIGCGQFFLGSSFYLLEFLFCQSFVTKQHPAEFHQRIGLLDISQLVFITIQRMVVRIGMRTDTHTVGMHDDRHTVGYGKLAGFRHGIH